MGHATIDYQIMIMQLAKLVGLFESWNASYIVVPKWPSVQYGDHGTYKRMLLPMLWYNYFYRNIFYTNISIAICYCYCQHNSCQHNHFYRNSQLFQDQNDELGSSLVGEIMIRPSWLTMGVIKTLGESNPIVEAIPSGLLYQQIHLFFGSTIMNNLLLTIVSHWTNHC